MISKNRVPHIITIVALALFIVLSIASGSSQAATYSGNSGDAVAAYIRGANYSDSGDYNRAITEYTAALRIDPLFISAYSQRGYAYGQIGDYDRAIADFDLAIGLEPHEFYYNNRGWYYCMIGNWDQAIADATEALRLNPNFAHAYDTRGVAYHFKGDYNRAIADYETALRLNPDLSDTRSHLALAQRQQPPTYQVTQR